jgi:hypothetical protein
MTKPFIGTSVSGARVVGVQTISFSVQYMAREGDASTPGPQEEQILTDPRVAVAGRSPAAAHQRMNQ